MVFVLLETTRNLAVLIPSGHEDVAFGGELKPRL